MRILSLIFVVSFAGCTPGIRHPESSQVIFTGTITAGGFETRGDRLKEATVRLLNAGDGSELAKNVTSAAGGYRLALNVTAPTRVVLVAEAIGFAPMARAYTVGPSTELTISASLTPAVGFDCLDTQCTAGFQDVRWSEPPPAAEGEAATFHEEQPVLVDVDAARSTLLSTAWLKVMGDRSGRFLLRVPRANWSKVSDATPGNGTLEVNAARFDVATAQWVALAPVPVVTEAGLAIPEGTVLEGTFMGVSASLPVTADGFYAVLGAADGDLGCVSSSLVADGKPAVGAMFSFPGFEPVVASGDGATFCAQAKASSETVDVKVQYAGLPYAIGRVKSPAGAGVCGGSCTVIDPMVIRADAVRSTALCDFTGKVLGAEGAPVANAVVVGTDDSVAGNAVTAFCGEQGTRCRLASPTTADGSFRLVIPMSAMATIGARTSSDGFRGASITFTTCPTTPLTLNLDSGATQVEVIAELTGAQITWLPALPASRISVFDVDGAKKWEVTSALGMRGVVLYATVPAGATQTVAAMGTLITGDSVVVEVSGVDQNNITFAGAAVIAVP